MTPQEFFNTVVLGLIAQGRPSIDSVSCKYRGEGETKCAIGLLIPDEEYEQNPNEETGVGVLIFEGVWPTLNKIARTVPEKLMAAMQSAHDGAGMFQNQHGQYHGFGDYSSPAETDLNWLENFKGRAKIVAEAWDLKYPEDA